MYKNRESSSKNLLTFIYKHVTIYNSIGVEGPIVKIMYCWLIILAISQIFFFFYHVTKWLEFIFKVNK